MGRHAFTAVVLSHARCKRVLGPWRAIFKNCGGMNAWAFFLFPLPLFHGGQVCFVYWFLSFVFSYFLHYNGTPALFRLRYWLWDG